MAESSPPIVTTKVVNTSSQSRPSSPSFTNNNNNDNSVKNEEQSQPPQQQQRPKHRGSRELHEITVETYNNCTNDPKLMSRQTSVKSTSSKESTPELSSLELNSETAIRSQSQGAIGSTIGSERKLVSGSVASLNQIQFYSGNHFVEVTKGILHLYKENKLTPLGEEAERSEMVCILSVPAAMTIHDVLQFTAPVNQDIKHIRIIRDNKPNQYMVLIKFCNQRSADEFYNTYNGIRFNSIEPEVCHLVFVAQVETVKESDNSCLPIVGFTELPTCPVCLERMDESVEGILTILCNHSFHGECLDKWGDTSCPVCRYCQTPELIPDNRCFECGSQASQQDSLWICLICGHIGCGRYVEGHAYKHYCETQHTYAMQLGLNNRVWDYAGDNYVHRLLQNKDGKPVEVECNQPMNDEKIDSVQLEYTYLLTNQLEAQRHYFEETLSRIENDAHHQINEILDKNKIIVEERDELKSSLISITKDKNSLDKKVNQLTTKLNKTQSELQEERELNKCLRENQSEWQKRLSETETQLKEFKLNKDKEISELQEQVRDLMFFLETQEKLKSVSDETRDEIASGHIVVQSNDSPSSSKPKSKVKKR
jgi:BRCA1-associated protein